MTVAVAGIQRVTEREVLNRLRARYGDVHGNGRRWVFATHVRSDAGFDATRTADAVAMDLWPSKGLEIHGFEVKVSRSDWLRELASPDKHTAVGRYCDRWWLVVPDRSIVKAGELPADWGLIECGEPAAVNVDSGSRLYRTLLVQSQRSAVRTVRSAPKRRNVQPAGRSFMAALLRATMKTAMTDAAAGGAS